MKYKMFKETKFLNEDIHNFFNDFMKLTWV